MRTRSFFALVLVTVLLVAAAGYALMTGDRAASAPPPGRLALPGLAAKLGDLAWMRLSHGQTNIDFAAIGGRWAVVEKGNYPADQAKIRRVLLGLADLTVLEPKTERPALFSRLGLDDPSNGRSTEITVQDRTGATLGALIVGKRRDDRLGGGEPAVYIRKPGEERTWLARGALDLFGEAVSWLDRRIIDIPADRLALVTLTAPDGKALVLKRESQASVFKVADPPDDATLKSQAAIAAPGSALAGLDLDDVRPAAEMPVPGDGVATASFQTFEGLKIDGRLFTRDGVDWLALDASGSGAAEAEANALHAKLAAWVYAVPAPRAKLLRTAISDLIEPAKGS